MAARRDEGSRTLKRIAALGMGILLVLALWTGTAFAELVIDEDVPPTVLDEDELPAVIGGEEEELPVVIDWTERKPEWTDFAFPEGAKLLHIWMASIRDADAAVLSYDGQIWMIDAGDKRAGSLTAQMLEQLEINRIDKLFISHPHHDHMDGMTFICESARIKEMAISFPRDSTETMIRMLAFAEEQKIRITEYGDEDHFEMGDGNVSLHVWMKSDETRSMNDQSSQMMLRYGERTMLFTADMERAGQKDLLAAVGAEALKADLLKYPHHGKLALLDDFMNAVSPERVIVTNHQGAGEQAYYLSVKHMKTIYTNRKDVFLHLATDGEHWLCEYIPVRKNR